MFSNIQVDSDSLAGKEDEQKKEISKRTDASLSEKVFQRLVLSTTAELPLEVKASLTPTASSVIVPTLTLLAAHPSKQQTLLERGMLTQFQEFPKSSQKNISDLKELGEFLKLVAEGEQEKAEAMLKNNPALALAPGDVRDLSKRMFINITGFQYAVWALDWHMWTMIRKYLPDDAAQEQAQRFETGAWVISHGVHANLNILIKAYRTTSDLYDQKRYEEGNKAWVQQVGRAQRLLPAHVINEYCHPMRAFYPLPNFKDAVALPRSRNLLVGEWFTASYNGGGLGEKFAYLRDGWSEGRARRGAAGESSEDYEGICALANTRTAQRDELIAELSPPRSARASRANFF